MSRFLLCLTGVLGLLTAAHAQLPAASSQAVITAQVSSRSMPQQSEILASVRARESVAISAPVSELLSAIKFEQGESVNQGQLLVELAHASESARLRGAQAAQAEAQASLQRIKDLRRKDLSSAAELDLAQARALSARAAVDEAQAALDERMIRAPFSGVLGLRDVSPGAYLAAGDVITTLQDVSQLELEFQLPEEALSLWAGDAKLLVRVPSLNNAEMTARPLVDAGQLSPQSRSLRARAVLQSSHASLRPGMLAVISLQAAQQDVLSIPEAALIPQDDSYSVFVVDQGKAQRVAVSIGRRLRGWVQISLGLQQGQIVVVHGGSKLRDGMAVSELGRYDGSVSVAQMLRQAGQTP